MKPSQKASHLIKRFQTERGSIMCVKDASHAATILVQEIIRNIKESIPILANTNELVGSKEYWESVEIELGIIRRNQKL